MGGNIPGGNFRGGIPTGSLMGGNFPGGNFPRTITNNLFKIVPIGFSQNGDTKVSLPIVEMFRVVSSLLIIFA